MKREHLVADVLGSPSHLSANTPVMLSGIKHAKGTVHQSDGIPSFSAHGCFYSALRGKWVPRH
jgi:hypothetical protein